MTKLINKNTAIQTKKSDIFCTGQSNQPGVNIHAMKAGDQGQGNHLLGKFELGGMPPARGDQRHL